MSKEMEALEIIKQALERNEPKQPRFVEVCVVNNRPEYECPNCGQGLPLYEYFECWFCYNCGQRLDWGGEDE